MHEVTITRIDSARWAQAKSLLAVKGKDTFLDFIAKQVRASARAS